MIVAGVDSSLTWPEATVVTIRVSTSSNVIDGVSATNVPAMPYRESRERGFAEPYPGYFRQLDLEPGR